MKKRILSIETEKTIIERYANRETGNYIAKSLGINPNDVKRCLIKYKIKIRKPCDYKILSKGFTSREQRDELIIKMNREGKTYEFIQKSLGIGENTIGRCLKRNGIKTDKSRYSHPVSEETKRKISIKNLGAHRSDEAKKKMRLSHLGKTYPKELYPNYGMTGKTSSKKGLTYEQMYGEEKAKRLKDEMRKKVKGIKRSKEIIEKIKKNSWIRGKHHSEKTINKIKQARAKQIFPMQDTSIERKIQDFLSQLHIEYLAHKYISKIEHKYCCDIFIPVQKGINQKTIIECDGDYWHGHSDLYEKWKSNLRILEQIKRDKIRNKELIKQGFRVIRLWEREINFMQLNDLKMKIWQL